MARGGARRGSGRRSLGKADRLLIGARCDAEWRGLAEAHAMERHDERIDCEGIHESRRILDSIPLHYRPMVTERAYQSSPNTKGLPAEIKEAVDQLHHLHWVELNGRQRFISFRTPQGEQDEVIARIAADEAIKRKIPISTRQVRRCWDDYRSWCEEQRLNSGKAESD